MCVSVITESIKTQKLSSNVSKSPDLETPLTMATQVTKVTMVTQVTKVTMVTLISCA